MFVAQAHINSDLASKSKALREETSALVRLINRDQAEQAGFAAGIRAAADETKNDAGAYQDGYDTGMAGVTETDAANQAAMAPNNNDSGKSKAVIQGQADEQEAQAGTWVDESEVDDDF